MFGSLTSPMSRQYQYLFHGRANGLVPLLPASRCESDQAIRIALGERHAEECVLKNGLSGGFWIVSHVHVSVSLPHMHLMCISTLVGRTWASFARCESMKVYSKSFVSMMSRRLEQFLRQVM